MFEFTVKNRDPSNNYPTSDGTPKILSTMNTTLYFSGIFQLLLLFQKLCLDLMIKTDETS